MRTRFVEELRHKLGRLFPGTQVFPCRHAMGGIGLTEGDLMAAR